MQLYCNGIGPEGADSLHEALAENETLCEAAEHAAESRGDSVYEAETYTLSQTAIVADLQLAVVRFWETGTVLWQLVQAVDIVSIVRDPFKPDRHAKKLGVLVWVLSEHS